jgi:hypothetical protein
MTPLDDEESPPGLRIPPLELLSAYAPPLRAGDRQMPSDRIFTNHVTSDRKDFI